MDLKEFVLSHLNAPPARVLEVGCGAGELARALAAAGHHVTAIDPCAPEGVIFRRMTLEELEEPTPFDAVVAVRSLHHVADLRPVLEKVVRLLAEGGVLVLDEYGWDLLDEPTAEWYRRRARPDVSLEQCVHDWVEGLAGLHGYRALRTELDRRFRQRFFAWTPYLHSLLDEPELEALERELIEAGEIRALGFRYVGEPLRPPALSARSRGARAPGTRAGRSG